MAAAGYKGLGCELVCNILRGDAVIWGEAVGLNVAKPEHGVSRGDEAANCSRVRLVPETFTRLFYVQGISCQALSGVEVL